LQAFKTGHYSPFIKKVAVLGKKNYYDYVLIFCHIQALQHNFFFISILRKWKGRWWLSRTSNPVHRVNSLVGGFDSHALPPLLEIAIKKARAHCPGLFYCLYLNRSC